MKINVYVHMWVYVIVAVENHVSPIFISLRFLFSRGGKQKYSPLTIISGINLFYGTSNKEMVSKLVLNA